MAAVMLYLATDTRIKQWTRREKTEAAAPSQTDPCCHAAEHAVPGTKVSSPTMVNPISCHGQGSRPCVSLTLGKRLGCC